MMKLRKTICILVMIMLLSCFTVTAFATTQEDGNVPEVPDAIALVTVDNVNCKVINDIKDLSVLIKFKDSGKVIANVPVVRVEDYGDDSVALWLGYEPTEAILDDIKDEMSEIQKDLHIPSWKELAKLIQTSSEDELDAYLETLEKTLETITGSYTVELTGLPEVADHEYKYEADVMILNSKLVNEILTFCKEILGELLGMTDAELAKITSFSGMLDAIEQDLVKMGVLKEGEDLLSWLEESGVVEFTAQDKAKIEDALAEIDSILAYMKSEAYKGTVIAGVEVKCGCPYLMEYEIVHQYFKVTNGNVTLVGTVREGDYQSSEGITKVYREWEGFQVKASDYKNCEYKGKTYHYIGSYDAYNECFDDMDAQDFYDERQYYDRYEAVTEYTLNLDKNDFAGLLLCYEIVDNTESSPSTGDDSDMSIYFAIMALAVAVMASSVFIRRKTN